MSSGKILFAEQDGNYVLKFVGDVRLTLCSTLDQFLASTLENDNFKTVLIDLTETEGIDSTSLGLLAKISVRMKQRFQQLPTIISTNEDITRVLLSMGFDRVFILIQETFEGQAALQELDVLQDSEENVRSCVLDAHRTLMELNDDNREKFQDLVRSLEIEG
ncbi:anti-sigma factor antagonist [Motiliproteus coralliicola]|uniref:Anti-sigma factor antagonist n=1 Tax=Motiliproteus coralliicola TaxID=2283196 RepID=A0A369WE36_9GAMM|nr:STAS domain-containing protein [Motiliproteus coralliicola]RDE19591.1 anti-sigma factor antagonist [Motiliproteus coralliicola]